MKNRLVYGLSLALLLGGTGASIAAPAAPATTPAIGYVDLDAVVPNGALFKTEQATIVQRKKELDDTLQREQLVAMLNSDERKTYDTLHAKPNPTDDEKKQITDLESQTQKRQDELQQLQVVQAPTDAQKARLQELTKLYTDAADRLQKRKADFEKELNDRMQASWDKVQGVVLKAVEEVAKDQGLALVVDKKVRLYGGIDITDAVVKKLAK